MNKKGLICLPLIAATLGGCDLLGLLDPLGFFKKDKFDVDKTGPAEVLGYKRADKIVEGKKYIFGYYDTKQEQMRFASGNYHSDSKGEYPFYMETTSGTTEGAAEFTFTAVGNNEYTVKVTCSDSNKPWNNKMLAIYEADSSYNNKVMSIADADNLADKYETPGHLFVDVYGKFKFYNTVDVGGTKYGVNTIGMEYQYVDAGDEEKLLRLFGCKCEEDESDDNTYVSIDCTNPAKWTSTGYSLAHLYEKK